MIGKRVPYVVSLMWLTVSFDNVSLSNLYVEWSYFCKFMWAPIFNYLDKRPRSWQSWPRPYPLAAFPQALVGAPSSPREHCYLEAPWYRVRLQPNLLQLLYAVENTLNKQTFNISNLLKSLMWAVQYTMEAHCCTPGHVVYSSSATIQHQDRVAHCQLLAQAQMPKL